MFDLGTLARYPFSGKSEQAVREEWIRPLLVHLGYGSETLNEVRYEAQLRLRAPFRRIGRDHVKVDYVPTVLGHGLWIIEAKAHGAADWDETLSQAWLYATHPEIDAPFMVIADGSRIAVYDVQEADWDRPEVDISTPELAARFQDLADVVGAAQVTRAVRKRRMRHLGSAMKAEVSLARLDEYVQEVRRLADEARPAVVENQSSILRHQFENERRRRVELVSHHGLFAVGVWANQPLPLNLEAARLGIDHLRAIPAARWPEELERLGAASVHRRGGSGSRNHRMFWMLRVTRMEIILALRDEGTWAHSATALAKAGMRDHLLNFPDDSLARAAHRLERVLPVFLLRSLLAPDGVDLSRVAREIQQHWSDEARLRAGVDADRVLTNAVIEKTRRVWNTILWTEPVLSRTAAALEEAITDLPYRQDGALGPAGDPFLQLFLDMDYLQMVALQQFSRYFAADLVDHEVTDALQRLAATDSDLPTRFLVEPARALLRRIEDAK